MIAFIFQLIAVSTASLFLIIVTPAHAQQESETVATAAKKAFDQGEKELASGNHGGAITLLKTAVRIQPENAQYQHKLAKAFLAAQKYHEMWIHLRKATILELNNEEYSQDFLRMWRYHDLEGMFNVGTTPGTILKALGEPDRRIENGKMKRWVYGFMAVDYGTKTIDNKSQSGVFRVLDLRGYTADAASEVEQVSVKTDSSKWQVAHHHVSKSDDNLELTLKGEKIQQWSELFSKQRFPMLATTNATVDGMVNTMRKSLQAADPNVEFTVVSQTPTESVYHWVSTATADNPAQHEIAKIMKGRKDFYRVAYVKKTKRLGNAELAKWIRVIGDAKLIPLPNSKSGTESATSKSNTKLQAWELGKSLSFAALIRGKHGPDDVVKKTLLSVSRNAQALNVQVPSPEKLTEDVDADTAAAIHFLLDTAGKPIYNALQKKHGNQHSALFELATKSTLLKLLYQPGDANNQSFVAAIERAAQKAQLETGVWKPLTDRVNAKSTPKEIGDEIQRFQQRVAQAIGS